MNNRYANHPNDSKKYNTNQLREHYMVEEIFSDDKVELTYSHVDRIIFGGIKPVNESLKLEAGKSMGVDYFLERIENNNVDKYVASDVISAAIEGMRKNKKLTQDQQIDILIRIGKKPNMLRFYNIDNSKPKTITFNVVNSKNLTVKDFQNYYSKIREAK